MCVCLAGGLGVQDTWVERECRVIFCILIVIVGVSVSVDGEGRGQGVE